MPPVVGAIGTAAGALLSGTALTTLATQVVTGLVVNAVVGLAINAFSPVSEPQAAAVINGAEFEIQKGAKVVVDAVFGRGVATNHLWYHNWFGTDNEYGQVVYRQGYGEYDAMEGVLVDGSASSLSGANSDARGFVVNAFKVDAEGNPSSGGTPHLWVKYYTGAEGQAADPELIANANPAGRWTSSDKMTGMPYVIVTMRYHPKLFASGLPALNFVWRGLKQYDRRKDDTMPGGEGPHRWGTPSTYEWTENAAICQDTWRRGVWVNGVRVLGLGVSEAACHHGRTVAAANICDETIYFADTDTTRKRYTFGGAVRDGSDPIEVLKAFEAAMGGTGTETGGAYGPLPAQTHTPVMTIYDGDRVPGTAWRAKSRLSPTETKNAVHGTFTAPERGYRSDEYGLRKDDAIETAELGRRLRRLDFPQVIYRETATMLAEIARRRDLYSAVETLTIGPKGEALEPGDVITRNSEGAIGIRTMEVLVNKELGGMKHELVLREWNNAIVPTPTEGFVALPATAVSVAAPTLLTSVAGFGLAASTYTVSGSTVPGLVATWVPITDPTVDRVVIKYWPQSSPLDVRYWPVDAPGAGRAVIEGVLPLTTYEAVALMFTTPARATVPSGTATATTGELSVDAQIGSDIRALIDFGVLSARDIAEELEQLHATVADQDVGNHLDKKEIVAVFQSENHRVEATFTNLVSVLATEVEALSTAITAVSASVDEVTGDARISFEAQADTEDGYGRVTLQAKSSGTADALSMLALDAKSTGESRIYAVADGFYMADQDGNVFFGVSRDGTMFVGADGA